MWAKPIFHLFRICERFNFWLTVKLTFFVQGASVPQPGLTQAAGDAPGCCGASPCHWSPRCWEVNACGGQGRTWGPWAGVSTTWKSVGSATRLALLGASWAGNPQPERVSGKTRLASASPDQTPSLKNLKRVAEVELSDATRRAAGPRLCPHTSGLSEDDPGGLPDPRPRPRQVLSPRPPQISPVLSLETDHGRPTQSGETFPRVTYLCRTLRFLPIEDKHTRPEHSDAETLEETKPEQLSPSAPDPRRPRAPAGLWVPCEVASLWGKIESDQVTFDHAQEKRGNLIFVQKNQNPVGLP